MNIRVVSCADIIITASWCSI